MLTLRKKLAEILEQESLDLQEISQFLGIKEKEVLDHLQHIAKSARPKRLAVAPAATDSQELSRDRFRSTAIIP